MLPEKGIIHWPQGPFKLKLNENEIKTYANHSGTLRTFHVLNSHTELVGPLQDNAEEGILGPQDSTCLEHQGSDVLC